MPKSAPNFLYSSDPGLILGFHGCELGTRDKILNGKDMLRPSKKNYEWLGTGMYFWQNNYERALDFVSTKNGNRSKAAKPAVLGAVISLGNCLDLMDTAYLRLLHQSYEAIAIAADAMGKVLPMNKNIPFTNSPADKVLRYLDCSVIENLHQIVKDEKARPFDTVRGMYTEGNPVYDGAGFLDKTHIQICVRNPNCIKGFFIPREEVEWP